MLSPPFHPVVSRFLRYFDCIIQMNIAIIKFTD